MAKILLLNGPNLNLLGLREPDHYGRDTLETIEAKLVQLAQSEGHTLEALQSNAEHELIERPEQRGLMALSSIPLHLPIPALLFAMP